MTDWFAQRGWQPRRRVIQMGAPKGSSRLLKRAFRDVVVISGLIERQHPGKRKTGRQVTFSTDLIYDVLRKYHP